MNEMQLVDTTLQMLKANIKFDGHFQHFFKIGPDGFDGELFFRKPQDLPTFKVQIKKELRQYQLPHLYEMAKRETNYMIMAEKIFPAIKDELRNHGVNHVDAAGNIFIKTGNQTIWIDGHKYISPKIGGNNKAFTKTGLKAVFYLLINAEAINLPYRQLAEATGVALGNIKNIIDGLRQAGHVLPINKKTLKLQNKRALLEKWIIAYGERLKPALYLGTFNFWDNDRRVNWQNLPLEKGKAAWGGEPGGNLLTNFLNPEILTLYATEKAMLQKEWMLIPKQEGVLHVYQKFWKDDLYDQYMYAPPLLVYADLLLTDDPRCHGIAMMIYEKYLNHEFEHN
jgi:hypothetical protein